MKIAKATQKGFTLLELMVVIAIIGIIASIGIPSYIDYVKKGRATEATATLAILRIQMEQYYQDERTYVGGVCSPAGGGTHFGYNCSVAPTASVYTLRAVGVGDMNNFQFTVDQANGKTSKYDGVDGATCWKTSKTSTC